MHILIITQRNGLQIFPRIKKKYLDSLGNVYIKCLLIHEFNKKAITGGRQVFLVGKVELFFCLFVLSDILSFPFHITISS